MHTARPPAPQEQPTPPSPSHLPQTYPDSQTKTAPHSKSCLQNSARPPAGRPTKKYPSLVPPSTPGKTASHPFHTAGSAPPGRAPSPSTSTSSRRYRCAPKNVDTPRGTALSP